MYAKKEDYDRRVRVFTIVIAWTSLAIICINAYIVTPTTLQWFYGLLTGSIFCAPFTGLVKYGSFTRRQKSIIFPLVLIFGLSIVVEIAGGDKLYFFVAGVSLLVCSLYFDYIGMLVCVLVVDVLMLISALGVQWLSPGVIAPQVLFAEVFFFNFIASLLFGISCLAARSYLNAETKGLTFDSIMHITPTYVVLVDRSAKVTYLNDAALRLFCVPDFRLARGRPLVDLYTGKGLRVVMQDIMESSGSWSGVFTLAARGDPTICVGESYFVDDNKASRLFQWHDITQFVEERDEALALADAKSAFLANMSHEIRTPLNAIKGFSDLMRLTKLDQTQKNYANNIVHASDTLLHIINDLLDFSKMDADKLTLVEDEYDLTAFITDVVNACSLRAAEKGVSVIADIDPQLPQKLVADETRVKQIVMNLITNAVKYTKEGCVRISIDEKERFEHYAVIEYAVHDTGIGIKEEDIDKLFDEFIQLDRAKNKSIEGTGLGLSICKRLAEMMGGIMQVESEYGKGSTFSFCIPQRFASNDVLASVKNPKLFRVLVLGELSSGPYACRVFEKLGVSYHYVDIDDGDCNLDMLIETYDFSHVFYFYRPWHKKIEYSLLFSNDAIKKVVIKDLREAAFQKTPPHFMFLLEPLFIGSVAAVLNGETDRDTYERRLQREEALGLFSIAGGNILVVDDNEVNRMVCDSMLRLYHTNPDMAESGLEAVRRCDETKYDLIFMDHMMPEMDGVEAAKHIREKGRLNCTTPIIALTANVFSSNESLYFESGFADFLAKPVEAKDLNRILRKYIAEDKIVVKDDQETQGDSELAVEEDRAFMFFEIGIDYREGLRFSGDSATAYHSILAAFIASTPARLSSMQEKVEQISRGAGEAEIEDFKVDIHALKGSLMSIGAKVLSQKAEALEMAAHSKIQEIIIGSYVEFQEQLSRLVEEVQTLMDREIAVTKLSGDEVVLRASLENIKQCLLASSYDEAEHTISYLLLYTFGEDIDDLLILIHRFIGSFSAETAVSYIDEVLNNFALKTSSDQSSSSWR